MLQGGRRTNKSSTCIFIPYSKHGVFSITFLIMIYDTAKSSVQWSCYIKLNNELYI